MEITFRIDVCRKSLYTLLFILVFAMPAFAGVEKNVGKKGDKEASYMFIDRWSFKTNVFDWLLTIPNFGVEFDFVNSPYNKMSISLNAKYNWNEYHKLAPPVVFNILDVRPEFRYYFRTKERVQRDPSQNEKSNWLKDKVFTTERKNARPWRAQYVGAYVNYGSYTLKFSPTGYQGKVVGFGASAGYGLPMYQYKKGAIDVELGFSVGLQFATREKFTHSADGNYYIKDWEASKGLHFTPFPVVSELRVAFVWRHRSIKEKVQEDVEKKKMKERLERAHAQVEAPFTDAKAKFDEQLGWIMEKSDIEKLKADKTQYRAQFIEYIESETNTLYEVTIPNLLIDDQMKGKLVEKVASLKAKALKAFDKELGHSSKESVKKPSKDSDKKVSKSDKKASKSDKKVSKSDKKASKSDKKVSKSDKKVSKSDKKASKSDKKTSKADKKSKKTKK